LSIRHWGFGARSFALSLRMLCEAEDSVHILPRVRAVAEVKRGARVVTTAPLRLGFRGVVLAYSSPTNQTRVSVS
jgi:hypothetical protein